ncbi:MAG: AAA family ATPase [Planctomycetes bacterium]|nr:AAA family ATPase [Planctomycetota bacterium]
MTELADRIRVPPARLRRTTDPLGLGFASTADIEPIAGIIGQDDAVEALRFGLSTDAQGHNIFVRGLTSSGRMSLVRELLEDIQPWCPLSADQCYVHDFARPEQPMLITLPRGSGRAFGEAVEELLRFMRDDLQEAVESDALKAQRSRMEQDLRMRMESITRPFDEELRQNQLAVVTLNIGDTQQPAIMPLIDGQPAPPDRFELLRQQGRIDEPTAASIRERIEHYAERLAELHQELFDLQREHRDAVRRLHADELRRVLERVTRGIAQRFATPRVETFLRNVVDDLVSRVANAHGQVQIPADLYRVNVLHSITEPGCPILIETRPSLTNLLGTIERDFPRQGPPSSPDHLQIRAGSLLRANGGFLILDAHDLLSEPGAWRGLVRTLRSGRLQIAPPEVVFFSSHAGVKPEPIDVNVKVILVGDTQLHYMLDALDPDFPHLFKVLADFAPDIPRDPTGEHRYAGVLARIAEERKLPHFTAGAVAALVEHGARIAGRADRLTSRFGRLVDIAHEAAYIARQGGRDRTNEQDVHDAIRRGRARADLPARRFRERITSGAIRVQTRGAEIGQVNGLAVVSAGPLTFGFPQRITASIGAGTDGAIDVEAQASLSGSIHTKGFAILAGLLRHLLPVDHPLAFRASLAFEQSYGGVDGDSASGAELCCLISALTRLPIRQDLAMTGAIDQKGHVQPIGAANEKIEGFYDVCSATGLTGTQGVILPRANADELMLRREVARACEEGRFHVYAVETVHEALELFLGRPAGQLDANCAYPDGTVLALAVRRARDYWDMVSQGPAPRGDGGPSEDDRITAKLQ